MTRDRVLPDVAIFVAKRDDGCRAPYLGGSYMDCGGTLGYEHVQRDYGRMGRRAASCPCSLVVLCQLHREPGMRAGAVWCTSKGNRRAMRDYLSGFGYGDHHIDHAAMIVAHEALTS